VTDLLLWLSLISILVVLALLVRLSLQLGGGSSASEILRKELREGREELAARQRDAQEALDKSLKGLVSVQTSQLETLAKRFDAIRLTLDQRVKELQDGNQKKLDEMRKVVDEKLQTALEKKLSASFDSVRKQLESVHKGLGEMQVLAAGVGDLKRVLTNVKTRGTWAELQLGSILEQILAPGQFERNVEVRPGSRERVEFAVKFPGAKGGDQEQVWLPIDSKFPIEDYGRLQEAAEKADPVAVQAATKALAVAIKNAAKDIHSKYIDPPHSTNFAVLYLGTEGLYAEVVRHPALIEQLQQQYSINVAGPSTMAALLTSLRLGFQSLAIEKRSAEVWAVLGAVKQEFGRFGDVLGKVQKQLEAASRTIEDDVGRRTRAMERKLREVEELPESDAADILPLTSSDASDASDEEA